MHHKWTGKLQYDSISAPLCDSSITVSCDTIRPLSRSNPSGSVAGRSRLVSLALASAHVRSRTRLRMRASLRAPWSSRMASLTRFATARRRLGSRRAASGGARSSGGKIRRAIVRSRSSRNSGFVGARGASCVDANSKDGLMSLLGSFNQARMSSMSWSRRRAK